MNYEKKIIRDIDFCGYIMSIHIEKKFEYQKLLQMNVTITLSENLMDGMLEKKINFFDVQDFDISNEINGTYYCRLIIKDVRERQLECCNYYVAEEESGCMHFFCKEYGC